MIIHFHAERSQPYADLCDQMFRQRAKVFQHILGWDVEVEDGRERDYYDVDCDPLYIVSVDDETRRVRGSFRYLPTTGPTLLKGSLGKLFHEPVDIDSPVIWECSRFAIDPDYPHTMIARGLTETTSELMMAGCRLALRSGISQIMAVYESYMERVYRRAGWEPTTIENNKGIAVGLWDVSDTALRRMSAIASKRLRVQHKPAA